MIINLKKFGVTLISRQAGKEAFSAFRHALNDISSNEEIIIDFAGVLTFSPSWGDEFLTPLILQFGQNVALKNTDNPSVKATLEILERTKEAPFNVLT